MKFERTGAPSPGASATSRASSPQSTSARARVRAEAHRTRVRERDERDGAGQHAPDEHGRHEHLRADRQRARVARHLCDDQRGLERPVSGAPSATSAKPASASAASSGSSQSAFASSSIARAGARVLRAQRVDGGEDRALVVVPARSPRRYSRGRSSQRLAIRFRLISVVPTATPAVIASRQYDSAKFPYASASAP